MSQAGLQIATHAGTARGLADIVSVFVDRHDDPQWIQNAALVVEDHLRTLADRLEEMAGEVERGSHA